MKIFFILIFVVNLNNVRSQAPGQWSTDKANAWYAQQKHPLVGSNYIPSYAINQLEHWQAETFNATRIDQELSWAQNLGYNTLRVFLHDLAYTADPTGFKQRIDTFLSITDKRGIKPYFYSDWNGHPQIGAQPQPRPGVHNSGWVKSPGDLYISNSSDYPRIEGYVKDLIGTYGNDSRVLFWDVWNEPENDDLVALLLPQVYQWAHSLNPIQPLTSGLFGYGTADNYQPNRIQQIQLNNSDIITFHDYGPANGFEAFIKALQKFNRPIFCSEYMARPLGSTFVVIMPVAKQYNVGVTNWGFVNGKTQTNFPWDSEKDPYTTWLPAEWFHDVLRTDGTPYMQEEVLTIKHITGCPNGYLSKVNNWTCYQSFGTSNQLSWDAAEAACKQDIYGKLVSVDSAFENTDLLNYAKATNPNCNKFYIGLYNSKYYTSADNFTWVNHDTGTFRNWAKGSPSNDPNANCVALNANDGTWSNQACATPQCYICGY